MSSDSSSDTSSDTSSDMTDSDDQTTNTSQSAREATSGPGRFMAAGVPGAKPENLGMSTRRLLTMMHPERAGLIAVLGLAVGAVTLTVIGPKILGRATDIIVSGLRSPAGIDRHHLGRILLVALVLYVGGAALGYLQNYLLAGVVQRTMFRLRTDVEDKVNRLPLRYVDRQPRGDLLSRVTNDIDNIAQSLQQSLGQLLTSALTIVGVLVMMLIISPLLTLVALVTIPAALASTKAIAKRSKPRFVAQWADTGRLNSQVEEAFTGHALLKVYGQRANKEAAFDEVNNRVYDAGYGAQFIAGVIQPMMMFLANLNFVAIAVIGGIRVSAGALSLGDIQAFIQYSRQFTQPLTQVASMMNILQSGIASAERVFALLDAEEEVPDPAVPNQIRDRRGKVEFDGVSFAYDANRPLIRSLSLVAEPGQTIAIVGPTGAGKTTLVNLLMRFYDLDDGTIAIDDVDIASMSRSDVRLNIGMVLQDTWLFGGTIRENIAYGNLDATEEQILAAARATYVDRFVHSLPDGYDTIIDDEGGAISAGEKQLLTIARAFLADPTILILDEATSSVDTRTEVLIQHAMAALRSERTSFVIAHRLSTIRDADVILVMGDGRIVEQGAHDDLLAAGGAYADLYNSQFAAPAEAIA